MFLAIFHKSVVRLNVRLILRLLILLTRRNLLTWLVIFHYAIHSFDSSHYTLSLPLILSSFFIVMCVHVCHVCVCAYILIYIYVCVCVCVCVCIYISFFLFASLFLCETISLHICVNVQLNNRRQWLDRTAFDDIFFSIFLIDFSLGVLQRMCSALAWRSLPPFLLYLFR